MLNLRWQLLFHNEYLAHNLGYDLNLKISTHKKVPTLGLDNFLEYFCNFSRLGQRNYSIRIC
jgi:hypothetical protein